MVLRSQSATSKEGVARESLQAFDGVGSKKGAHLADGDLVELLQTIGLRESLTDQDGVHAFEIGQDDKLLDGGLIPDVPLGLGIGIAPFLGGLSEEGDIQEVGLGSVFQNGVLFGEGRWNLDIPDRIGLVAVVDFGKCPLVVPTEL